LALLEASTPLSDLASIPNAIALTASARNADAARQVLDWLVGEPGNKATSQVTSAPPLDVAWCRQQYALTRRRWAQSGFGPKA
jgi:hypothetical protein